LVSLTQEVIILLRKKMRNLKEILLKNKKKMLKGWRIKNVKRKK